MRTGRGEATYSLGFLKKENIFSENLIVNKILEQEILIVNKIESSPSEETTFCLPSVPLRIVDHSEAHQVSLLLYQSR